MFSCTVAQYAAMFERYHQIRDEAQKQEHLASIQFPTYSRFVPKVQRSEILDQDCLHLGATDAIRFKRILVSLRRVRGM